jgi:hypothetical protein
MMFPKLWRMDSRFVTSCAVGDKKIAASSTYMERQRPVEPSGRSVEDA